MPARSLRDFLRTEAASSVVLVAAAIAALAWASSPWKASYRTAWSATFVLSAHDWVNEALMAVFFLVVGLELRRELVVGDLRDRRHVALAALAAVAGMVVPALAYLAFTAGHTGSRGWAVAMPTDIAFALGVVVLLGPRVPPSLRLFLLTLGIVDDVLSVVVLAVVYSADVVWLPLVVAVLVLAGVLLLGRRGALSTPLFLVGGVAVWVAAHHAGIPGSVAGAAVGLCGPSRSAWLEDGLHPWSSFLVVPMFALANARVVLGTDALTSRVAIGLVGARVIGKPAGIVAAAWVACRAGVARVPAGVRWRQLTGVAALAGMPFTISLLIVPLALPPALQATARVAVLGALVLSGLVGAAFLVSAPRNVGTIPPGGSAPIEESP